MTTEAPSPDDLLVDEVARALARARPVVRVASSARVVIVNDFATLEGARAFSQDPSLPAAMERGGVEGRPQVWIVDEAEARQY